MRLWREIAAQLNEGGLKGDVFNCTYVVSQGVGGYFENVKGLGAFSPSRVCLQLNKGVLTVEGENLKIERYGEGDVAITGNIRRVSQGERE